MLWKRKSVGLALGGGGARGLAHIGIIRVFEQEAIPIDIVVGTSIGALVGAAYASGMSPDEMEKKTDEFLNSSIFQGSVLSSIKEAEAADRLTVTRKIQGFFKDRLYLLKAMFKLGILQSEDFQAMIDYFIPDILVEDTRIPFRAVVTDLVSGEPIVISKGPLRKAVMASCAVPGAVPPIEKDSMLLSDGGIINLVPTTVAREEGAEFVVAVSVNKEIYSDEKLGSAMDIYVRATEILSFHLERSMLEEADVVIHPRVGGLHWTDFLLARELIEAGEKAAREKLDLIRKGLHLPGAWATLTNFLKGLAPDNSPLQGVS